MFFKKFTDVLFTEEVKSGKEQVSLKDGNQEREYVDYHDNGQLWFKGKFNNDVQVGEWIY